MDIKKIILYLFFMPTRHDIFLNNGIYHIFNKTIDGKKIFDNLQLCKQFLNLCTYYRSLKASIRYSEFNELPVFIKRNKLREIMFKKYFKVEILCYCLMPNHFHLILMQKSENGIVRYMSDIINALTRYSNTVENRKGPIFLTQFKSRMIINREQFVHVSRYIHLNPYTAGIVKNISYLEKYNLSSFSDYIQENKNSINNVAPILNEFDNDREKYRKFVVDNAEYQKTLELLKHVEKWL